MAFLAPLISGVAGGAASALGGGLASGAASSAAGGLFSNIAGPMLTGAAQTGKLFQNFAPAARQGASLTSFGTNFGRGFGGQEGAQGWGGAFGNLARDNMLRSLFGQEEKKQQQPFAMPLPLYPLNSNNVYYR